jgi:hypothetical protein
MDGFAGAGDSWQRQRQQRAVQGSGNQGRNDGRWGPSGGGTGGGWGPDDHYPQRGSNWEGELCLLNFLEL